jgi:hypothetical protein
VWPGCRRAAPARWPGASTATRVSLPTS